MSLLADSTLSGTGEPSTCIKEKSYINSATYSYAFAKLLCTEKQY
jgi:hypothetical protein